MPDEPAAQPIRMQVTGPLIRDADGGTFRIAAAGLSVRLSAGDTPSALAAIEGLAGKRATASGTYVEQRDADGSVRRRLAVARLAPAAPGAADAIDVTITGRLRSGIMAIGAETTGVTVTAGAVTWELDVPGSLRAAIDRLNGKPVTVSGRLRQQGGVEIRSRRILRVRSLKAAGA